MLLESGTTVDRYTIDSLIGTGGMAAVYLVRHVQLGTHHALKVLQSSGEVIHQRLLQEGRVQARLRHANIVNVTDVIDINGSPGLIMEYVRGPSLDALLTDHRLNMEQIDFIVRGILAGVGHAHRRDLVHRDLKPMNVICSVEEGRVIPKVLDFGLVKALSEDSDGLQKTRSGVFMGTPHYMSPEQIRSTRGVDQRTDLWAIGVILYELATGRVPFVGEDVFEIFQATNLGEYADVLELNPGLPIRMVRAIRGALVVDQDHRVSSCERLLAIWEGDVSTDSTPMPARRTGGTAWAELGLESYCRTPAPVSASPTEDGSGGTWVHDTLEDPGGQAWPVQSELPPSEAETELLTLSEEPSVATIAETPTAQVIRQTVDELARPNEPPRQRRAWPLVFAAAIVAIALLAVWASAVGVGLAMWPEPKPAAELSAEHKDVKEESTVPEPIDRVPEAPEPVAESTVVSRPPEAQPRPVPIPEPDRVKESPPPAPEAATTEEPVAEVLPEAHESIATPKTTWGWQGDVTSVYLQSGVVQVFEMGEVEPGTYDIWLQTDPNALQIKAGKVVIPPGGQIELVCSGASKRCR